MGFWTGKEEKMMQTPTMTGGQDNILSQLMQALSGQGGGGMFGQAFGQMGQNAQQYEPGKSPMEQMAQQQFQEQTVPQLTEQFAGMGAGSSSGFGQQMGAAGAGLQQQMAGMRQQQQQQQQQQLLQSLLGFGQMGLGAKSFENVFRPETTGFLGQAGAGLMQGLGQGIGTAGTAYGLKKFGLN